MGLQNNKFNGTFASILADGSISVKCEEGEFGAVRREYEDSQTKEMKVKFEKIYTELSGYIAGIKFFEGEYGKQLQLSVKDGEDEIVLGFPVNSNFCEDLMKKLPNVKFNQPVVIKPYSFIDKVKKTPKKGVTIIQEDEKINSFFSKVEGDKVITTNGLPVPEEGKKYDADDWKMHFMIVRKFLVNFIESQVAPMINFVDNSVAAEMTEEDHKVVEEMMTQEDQTPEPGSIAAGNNESLKTENINVDDIVLD